MIKGRSMTTKHTLKRFNFASLTSWKSAILTVGVILIVGMLSLKAVRDRPVSPIVIDERGLTPTQITALKTTLAPIGDVQFFSSDLEEIHRAVLQQSWVESAEVWRDWYTGITVSVTPRRAVANFGSQHLIDAHGVVFEPTDKNKAMDENLTLLQGDSKNAKEIMEQMHRVNTWFAPLGIHAKNIMLTPRQTWYIHFDNGMRVIVDRENTQQKLYGLPKILQHNYKNQLSKIDYVDLRYKNGFVIAWKNNNAE